MNGGYNGKPWGSVDIDTARRAAIEAWQSAVGQVFAPPAKAAIFEIKMRDLCIALGFPPDEVH